MKEKRKPQAEGTAERWRQKDKGIAGTSSAIAQILFTF
jgi:hypothetical protein